MLEETLEKSKVENLSKHANQFAISINHTEIEQIVTKYLHKEYPPEDTEWNTILKNCETKIRNSTLPPQKSSSTLPYLRKFLSRHDPINEIWDKQWRDNLRLNESYFSTEGSAAPYDWKGRHLNMRNAGGTLTRMLMFVNVIRELQPSSVLEVAFGDGLNLFFLASFFPDIKFYGVELTKGGVNVAKKFQQHFELPSYIANVFPNHNLDKKAFKNIHFYKGNAKKLSFHDNSFDLVISCVGLEQMESIREKAISELSRVARHWTAMLEPFYDFNSEGMTKEYVKINNYFSGAIQELPKFNLEPCFVNDNIPQKLNLNVGLVLSRKKKTMAKR